MYHYAGNNPIRYTDPDGRSDTLDDFAYQKRTENSPYKQETWTATETLTLTGGEMRFCNSGMTMLKGTAIVVFSNGKESFTKEFEVISTYSEGIFFSIGTSVTGTTYTRSFPVGTSKDKIIESYEGIFATNGISLSTPSDILTVSYAKTFTVNPETQDIDPEGWQGITKGFSFGLSPDTFSINLGTQITVYRDPDKSNNSFYDHPEWFYYKVLIPNEVNQNEK